MTRTWKSVPGARNCWLSSDGRVIVRSRGLYELTASGNGPRIGWFSNLRDAKAAS